MKIRSMRAMIGMAVVLGLGTLSAGLAIGQTTEFEDPVRVTGDGEAIRVESPGYAAPCWSDVDGDGDKDLLVGQFNGGKIQVCYNDGDGELSAAQWLEAGGKVAEVPGVW